MKPQAIVLALFLNLTQAVKIDQKWGVKDLTDDVVAY